MLRGLIRFGGAAIAVGLTLFIGLKKSGKVDFPGDFAPGIDAAFQSGLQSDAMVRINRVRTPAEVSEVRGDAVIQTFLEEFVTAHSDPENIQLDDIFDALQSEFPGAQYLAANLIMSRSREDLLSKLTGWTAVVNPDFNSINTAAFKVGSRLGALGIMSRRIPAFSLRAANEEGGRFFNRCPHCGVIHALELDRDSQTLILSCPHCDLPFDVLALGTSGKICRATDFLEGFELKMQGREPLLNEGMIVDLWGRVADQCAYELDQERNPGEAKSGDHPHSREVWKTSSETWKEAAGDCEDTAILLADVLISAGFDARIAIGWNGNIGQHAWVVVRLEDRQFVLETTLQKKIERNDLVDLVEASPFYQPEQLFDREHIYYTSSEPELFRLDYFSDSLWKTIPTEAEGSHAVSLR